MEMAGTAEGATSGNRRANSTSFKPGENSRTRFRTEVQAKLEQLTAVYDVQHAADQLLVALAAKHLADADHARGSVRVRCTNAALRILSGLPKRPAPPAPPLNAYSGKAP